MGLLDWMTSPERTQQLQGLGNNLKGAIENLKQQRGLLDAASRDSRRTGLLFPDTPAQHALDESIRNGVVNSIGPLQITAETAPILAAMTKQEFLGNPKIVGKGDAKDLIPLPIRSLADVEQVPFMDGKYQAKYSPHGAAVFDGEKPIASYNFGDTLVVDPKYRKQGIGSELVYQQRTSYPEPAKASTRNKVSHGIQQDVWERIQNDLAAMQAPTAARDAYVGGHKAPMKGNGAPLHDLTQVYPDDIYSPKAQQFYGTGEPALDRGTFRKVAAYKGNPDAPVTMYRAVPSNVAENASINNGDWVTINPEYAKLHGEGPLGGDYRILEQQVKARKLFTNGDSIHEFGYDESGKITPELLALLGLGTAAGAGGYSYLQDKKPLQNLGLSR